MARGKIDEYKVGSFSPQAVGVPGEDKSGQIIASGIASLGQSLAVREDTSNNLSAMEKFGSFQLEYQQKKIELQQRYSNTPAEYPKALQQETEKLTSDMGKGLPSGVYNKFKYMTTSHLASDADNNVKWAFQRDNDIQVGKITSIKQNVALKAASAVGPDGLAEVMNDFTEVSKESTKFITPEADFKLTEMYKKLAINYNLDAQLLSRPNQLKAELDGGAYKDLLTADVIKEYSDKARTAIENRAIDDQYRTLFLGQDKVLGFMKGLDDGSTTIVDLIAERDAMMMNRRKVDVNGKPIVSEGYIKSLDALISGQTQSMRKTPLGKEAHKAALDNFDRKWAEYLQLKSTQNKRPDASDLEKELDLQAELQDSYNRGIIDKTEYDDKVAIMSTKHNLGKNAIAGAMPFNEAINKAGAVPGWFQKDNVLSAGFRLIKANVDKNYPELLPEEKRDLYTQMFSKYHQTIKSTPDEVLGKLTTDKDKQAYAQKLVNGTVGPDGKGSTGVTQQYSTFKNFKVGDADTDPIGGTKVFAGKNPHNGQPVWFLTPSTKVAVFTSKGKKWKAIGIDSASGAIQYEAIANE